MTLPEIHDRLADTATLFVAILAVWALFFRIRGQPLNSNWYGAAVIGELLLVAQVFIGVYLYYGRGLDVMLSRPFMHILYGIVSIITLPAAYSYFVHLEDEKVKALAMAAVCFFLWGIILRTGHVALYNVPGM